MVDSHVGSLCFTCIDPFSLFLWMHRCINTQIEMEEWHEFDAKATCYPTSTFWQTKYGNDQSTFLCPIVLCFFCWTLGGFFPLPSCNFSQTQGLSASLPALSKHDEKQLAAAWQCDYFLAIDSLQKIGQWVLLFYNFFLMWTCGFFHRDEEDWYMKY